LSGVIPTLWLVAGSNGVCTTTFPGERLTGQLKQLQFVNTDLAARGFKKLFFYA
jgi:predicted ABC-type ATPase